ncbi:MAG: hypothetical protein PUJ55_01645 [Clostridiales bacterium]|nr:hypothetical protein [Clostridiales bacterium]MDY4111568.1 hypothetical protein [Roseburia sp.]
MKLIDANSLKEYCMRASKSDDDFRRASLATLASVIDAQPTAYDVDKVVAQLNDKFRVVRTDEDLEWNRAMDDAITIVKGGGIDGKE